MKKTSQAAALILTIVLLLLLAPISTAHAGDLEVVATANPTTLFDGDSTIIEFTITNNTGASVDIDGYTIDGVYEWVNGLVLAPGESQTLISHHTADFGQNMDYGFRVEVHYDGWGTVYSNLIELHLDSYIIVDPPITTLEFEVSANKSSVKLGEDIEFSVRIKNTGNVTFEDFTPFMSAGAGDLINTFDLAPGEETTVFYVFTCYIDGPIPFGYFFDYTHEGTTRRITHPVADDFSIAFIPPMLSVTASASKATIASGDSSKITVKIDNTGGYPFQNVKLYDNNSKLVDSWTDIDINSSKSATITIAPAATTVYAYNVQAWYGQAYQTDSNVLKITVEKANPSSSADSSQAQDSSPTEEPAAAEAAQNEAAAEADAEGLADNDGDWRALEEEADSQNSGGLSTLTIILIAAVAAALIVVLVLVIYIKKAKKA